MNRLLRVQMADAKQEEIIIIQDNEVANLDNDSKSSKNSSDDELAKKKKILLFGIIAILLVLIIVIVTLLLLKSSQKVKDNSMTLIENKLREKQVAKLVPSKLENMIVKANYLYSSGSKKDALSLFEQIAQYSEAISLYNLGVAQLKDTQYKQAQNTFSKAIQNDEKRCVSAINAAVCSLHLQEKENFKYYIDLAYAYLPNEIDSPLYSYYYALINYYNNNYLESLSALKNKTSDEYPLIQKNLSAKINALFSNDYDAIDAMEKHREDTDDFSIALLYARIGDFTLASQHFEEAILKNIQPVKAQLALGLINLKAGRVARAAKEIKNVTDMFPQKVYKSYPIKVSIKESLFDAQKAQKVYRTKIQNSNMLDFQKIFYFSPYKIFNANKTISNIRKGNANIYIDNVKSAQGYLRESVSSSNVNYGITQAIKKALSFHLREANVQLLKLTKLQPKHSILQYNLGLTYAQMGYMTKAHKHFLLSYHLDAKNYLSGIYALMTAKLINKKSLKLKSIITESVSDEDDSEEKEFYLTLLSITKKDYISATSWLDNDFKERPLYLALNIIISTKFGKMEYAKKAVQRLTRLLPHDILPHILYIDTFFHDYNSLEYASASLNYLKLQKFHYADLYYGSYITRYLYVQQKLITGKLYYLSQRLEHVLETTSTNTQDIISTLAMVYLFDTEFEKAYTLYNLLIDELKIRDPKTLFLGAVASTTANHHGNAIALLELVNLKNKSYAQSRFALGLLYLEIQNNNGAVIQLKHILENHFFSEYFTFDINTDKLLFKKQHPKE